MGMPAHARASSRRNAAARGRNILVVLAVAGTAATVLMIVVFFAWHWSPQEATQESRAADLSIRDTRSASKSDSRPVPTTSASISPTPPAQATESKSEKTPPVRSKEVKEVAAASLPAVETPTPGGNEEAVPHVSSNAPILLSAERLTALRKKATANTPQWKAFKANLDQNLPEVIRSAFQGSQLAWISDYALGYLVLRDSDPATASKYADKAIAFIKSGLRDYQKGGWEARQFLARGDGSRKTFTLPHTDIIRSSMHVYLGKVEHTAVKRGSGPHDPVAFYASFLKVSDTPDGPPTYKEGVDWRHNHDLPNNVIDWSLDGKKPASGTTYYVTNTSGLGATNTTFVLTGNTITLPTAPRTDQAVWVDYIYGKHAPDYSTLAYQQTSGGGGGFTSILIDSTYTSRYLGKHIAMGLDWLDDYPGLSPSLRKEAMDLLVRWSDFLRDHGYEMDSPGSNYGAGAYVSRVMTALALAKRHPAGPRLLQEIVGYRRKYLIPTLEDEHTSLKGGFWSEGWNYGQLATQNLLLAALALEASGVIPAETAERHWAGEVVRHLVSAQSSPTTVYDGGDWYAYPAPFPGKELFYILAAVSDQEARSYANYILQKYPGRDSGNYMDLLFHDPSAPSSFWSALPVQHFASGTGLLTARSDWGRSPIWVACQIGNLLNANHQTYSPGQLQIKRGDDDLLINASAPGNSHTGKLRSTHGNLIVVDDNGEKKQTYRWSMGVWYGSPGVVVKAYEANKAYAYLSGDYRAAYSPANAPGTGGPVRELTRQVVYLRPAHVIVYDRVATLKASYPKQLRWHFLKPPQVHDDSFVATAGESKLFGQTFSSIPLTTNLAAVKVGSATVQELITQSASPSERLQLVSVLQVASAKTPSGDTARHVTSSDSRLEGAQVGKQVVLFGRDGKVPADASLTYEVSAADSLRHLLTDLPPGRKYHVKVGGTVRATATTSAQGTLAFTTSADSKQTVEIVPAP